MSLARWKGAALGTLSGFGLTTATTAIAGASATLGAIILDQVYGPNIYNFVEASVVSMVGNAAFGLAVWIPAGVVCGVAIGSNMPENFSSLNLINRYTVPAAGFIYVAVQTIGTVVGDAICKPYTNMTTGQHVASTAVGAAIDVVPILGITFGVAKGVAKIVEHCNKKSGKETLTGSSIFSLFTPWTKAQANPEDGNKTSEYENSIKDNQAAAEALSMHP